jgi:hypothetical protein
MKKYIEKAGRLLRELEGYLHLQRTAAIVLVASRGDA